jgi:GxxExxY protein
MAKNFNRCSLLAEDGSGARRTRSTTEGTESFDLLRVKKNLAMTENEIIDIVSDEAIYIHSKIGPGMLESVYKNCMAYRLRKRGLFVETEKPVPVTFEEVRMDCGYRADIVVEHKIIIEIKSIESIADIHIAQTLTYLRFLELRFGLILNFKTTLMKYGMKRVANGF